MRVLVAASCFDAHAVYAKLIDEPVEQVRPRRIERRTIALVLTKLAGALPPEHVLVLDLGVHLDERAGRRLLARRRVRCPLVAASDNGRQEKKKSR